MSELLSHPLDPLGPPGMGGIALLERDARCPKEDRRRGVQLFPDMSPLRCMPSRATIAFRDRDTTLIRGGRHNLDYRHQIETPTVGEARGRDHNLRDARSRDSCGTG